MKGKLRIRSLLMKCLCSGEQLRAEDKMISSSESLATKDFAVRQFSSQSGEPDQKPDATNIEEAEISLRERGSLNYEEARALLGRIEYQKRNFEAALQVFEGINISAVTPKIKLTLSRKEERHKRRSHNHGTPPMSIHAVSLLLEAIFLKGKSLQELGRFKEASESCKGILDMVESSLPEGLPENFGIDCKLQETVSKAVELLPELWKLADSPTDAITSYRRALLYNWRLDIMTTSKIQKEFSIFLLYNSCEASHPTLRSQMDSSFVPRNNIEEAILLLLILLRKMSLKSIKWDPSILDHLSFALSVAGDLRSLANQIESLPPNIIDEKDRYLLLALCYYGANDISAALNLLQISFSNKENPTNVQALLIASKTCTEIPSHAAEGVSYAQRAIESLRGKCDNLESTAHYVLGLSLSSQSKSAVSDSERVKGQLKSLRAFETADRMGIVRDPDILYHLSVENAEQRKLDVALYYAKCLLEREAGCSIKGWLLLARILSALRRFKDAETVIDAALDQTVPWEQGGLLRTKAKLEIAQGRLESAIKTYTQLLGLLRVQTKTFSSSKKLYQGRVNSSKNLESEIWHDLACLYTRLSQWQDAESCLSKSNCTSSCSASRCHAIGSIHEGKGLFNEALTAYKNALGIDPDHVSSLISTAVVLRKLDNKSNAVARSSLTNALSIDRMNHSAWYNLGLLYKDEGSILEAADCFQAAADLEETEPVEPLTLLQTRVKIRFH